MELSKPSVASQTQRHVFAEVLPLPASASVRGADVGRQYPRHGADVTVLRCLCGRGGSDACSVSRVGLHGEQVVHSGWVGKRVLDWGAAVG